MYAVEFESTIKDGLIIVPLEYKHKIGKQVKVILLSDQYSNDESVIPEFSSISINTKDYKFDRKYANER